MKSEKDVSFSFYALFYSPFFFFFFFSLLQGLEPDAGEVLIAIFVVNKVPPHQHAHQCVVQKSFFFFFKKKKVYEKLLFLSHTRTLK